MKNHKPNPRFPARRTFLKQMSLAAGAALVMPTIVPSSVLGANAPSKRVALGHIGVGGQGSGVMNGFLGLAQGQSVAVCDPIKERREAAATAGRAALCRRRPARAPTKAARPTTISASCSPATTSTRW